MLRIGLLTHTRTQQDRLKFLVQDCGHRVAHCTLIGDLDGAVAPESRTELDAWIVAVEPDGNDPADREAESRLVRWLDEESWVDRGAAVIFCDGAMPSTRDQQYSAWARRLKEKMNQLTGAVNLAKSAGGSAQRVWVLAASTGGPAAVRDFLNQLPSPLGIGFVYVQHIDAGFRDTLAQGISRRNHYPARVVEHGSIIRPDEVAVVSPDHATELLSNGTFLVSERPWSAPYRPSADSLIANVAHSYGGRSGVIVFTGMGNDGAAGSRLMRQKGGRVWVQTPASCVSPSMPAATLATDCVSFEGSPAVLARQLAREARQDCAVQNAALSDR